MVDYWKHTDKLGGTESPGEKFKENWLSDLPKQQWPAYIDESTKVILDSKSEIGETELTPTDFPKECGGYYKQGLVRVSGDYSNIPSTVKNISSADLRVGEIALELNELEIELSGTNSIDIDEKGRAVEAVVNKILIHKVDRFNPVEIPRKDLAPSEIAVEMLSDPTIAEHSDTVLTELGECVNEGLIHKLDEPQMTTELWDHQLEALERWVKKGKRGYVDMATATGKTVLGLATIAYEYGELHPKDMEKIEQRGRMEGDDARVLVVADRGLILEQWKEEFDEHLNIPPERTEGGDTIELDWGEVHFRNTKQLLNNPVEDYDLVILDEAHHYATGSGWGELLEEFDSDVLALSGSIDEGKGRDDRVRKALGRHLEEVDTYTLEEARKDGIIPEFEWNIVYAGFEKGRGLSDVTKRCEEGFEEYSPEIDLSKSNTDTSVSEPDLMTYTDIRNYSSTTEGKERKESDEGFKQFVSSLFSRRTSLWNKSPNLDTVSRMASEHADSKKCLVLVRSRKEVNEVQERILSCIDDGLDDDVKRIATTDREEQKEIIDEFKRMETGVLVGTGSLIGEGVDIPHAEVGINLDDGGGVNKTLLQRMGRVLRNPDDKEGAEFYNLVPIPIEEESAVPREDGKKLLENAAQYRSLGERIGRKPGYIEADDEVRDRVTSLEKSGVKMIERLSSADIYDYPDDDVAREMLESILEKPRNYPMVLEEFSADTEMVEDLSGGSDTTEKKEQGKQGTDETEQNPSTEKKEDSGPATKKRDTPDSKGRTTDIIEVSEALDTSIDQDYVLEVGEEEILLREVRQPFFGDEEVLSPLDSLEWGDLPVSVQMDFSGVRQAKLEVRDSILILIDDVQRDPDDSDVSAILRFGEDSMILNEEKEKIINEGTEMVEIERVSWTDMPLTGLDLQVIQIDKDERGEIVFGLSAID